MKTIFGTVTALGLIIGMTTAANATTCAQRAANCVKNGGDRGDCYSRVASCKRTCVYQGPRSNWPASGDCKAR